MTADRVLFDIDIHHFFLDENLQQLNNIISSPHFMNSDVPAFNPNQAFSEFIEETGSGGGMTKSWAACGCYFIV